MLEHSLLLLRQELQSSAQRSISRGGTFSLQTLAVESELREVQQRTAELQKKGNGLINQVGKLLQNGIKILKDNLGAKTSRDLIKIESPPAMPQNNFYDELKKSLADDGKGPILTIQAKVQTKESSLNASVKSSSSDEESDQKYLDLIDLLTVRMFQTDEDVKDSRVKNNEKSKKSSSLPRTFDKPGNSLQKSTSQTLLASSPAKAGTSSSSQLTAYERLFGHSRPGSRSSSPAPKEKKKVFITKHGSRVRHTSGGQEKPVVLEAKKKGETNSEE